ncbi:MAG: WG repeat-containing protein [Acidobacteria bacterium]|nr:WG repeat-containing protein [Acidobacteriota bacterium]
MHLLVFIALCLLGVDQYAPALDPFQFKLSKKETNMLHYQYVDRNGTVVLDAKRFREARSFSNGLAAVLADNQLWGFIDKTGKVAIAPTYEDVGDFSEGLAAVRLPEDTSGWTQTGWIFIDTAGREQFHVDFDIVYDFSENVALAQGEEAVYLIEKNGNVRKLFSLRDLSLGPESRPRFREGLLVVRDVKTGKYGFINAYGEMVIAPNYVDAASFKENVARVTINEGGSHLLGFVRKDASLVISPRFDIDFDFLRNSRDFSEGLAGVALIDDSNLAGPQFIFINKAGETIFSTESIDVGNFYEGVTFFFDIKSEKYGYLDSSGRTIIPPRYERADDFSEGLACVAING